MNINLDVGEGISNEEAMLALVDTCNIACGGHTGDEKTMIQTLRRAKQFDLRVGAHPSFEDRLNFGRKHVEVPRNILKSQLIGQIRTLNELAVAEGMNLGHVKAHGALYNEAAHSEDMARMLIEVIGFFKTDLCILAPYGSVLAHEAERLGVNYWLEAFADRNYSKDLNLLPRSDPRAVIDDPEVIRDRVIKMLRDERVKTSDGSDVHIEFDTICVHGDHPKALEILKELSTIKHV